MSFQDGGPNSVAKFRRKRQASRHMGPFEALFLDVELHALLYSGGLHALLYSGGLHALYSGELHSPDVPTIITSTEKGSYLSFPDVGLNHMGSATYGDKERRGDGEKQGRGGGQAGEKSRKYYNITTSLIRFSNQFSSNDYNSPDSM